MPEAESHSSEDGRTVSGPREVLHKTGATALQGFVLTQHPQIAYFSLATNEGDTDSFMGSRQKRLSAARPALDSLSGG